MNISNLMGNGLTITENILNSFHDLFGGIKAQDLENDFNVDQFNKKMSNINKNHKTEKMIWRRK